MGEAAMAEPIEVLRKFYWLLERGDAPGALALLHSEVEWTEAKRSPYYAGTLRGAQSVVSKVFEPITGDFEDFATTPSEFLAQGDRVISIGNYSGVARATKRHLLAPFVHSWTVLDGALRRFDQYTDSAAWKEPLSQ
jgi:uncharacterized protein